MMWIRRRGLARSGGDLRLACPGIHPLNPRACLPKSSKVQPQQAFDAETGNLALKSRYALCNRRQRRARSSKPPLIPRLVSTQLRCE